MSTQEIALQLTSLLREGKFDQVYDSLFDSEKIRHIEPQSEHFSNLTGLAAIKEKDAMMGANIEAVQSLEVGEAIISKNHIALPYKISLKLKDGNVFSLDEIIVYEVENGKIVLEQFFY